jgi:hypothetical protein
MELTIMRGVRLLGTAEIVQSLVIPWSEFGYETTRVNPKPLGLRSENPPSIDRVRVLGNPNPLGSGLLKL